MVIPIGYHDVEPGRLAAIVTCLEMFEQPVPLPENHAADWDIRRVEEPEADWYRALFRRIGEPYLWASRLSIATDELQVILNDPLVEVYVLARAGRDEGLLELDFRIPGECELSFLGVSTELLGSGAGRSLMNLANTRVWSGPVQLHRFWVHTCTLDHPAAVRFYERAGFRPYKRQVEVFEDPRAIGELASTAAPGVPLI